MTYMLILVKETVRKGTVNYLPVRGQIKSSQHQTTSVSTAEIQLKKRQKAPPHISNLLVKHRHVSLLICLLVRIALLPGRLREGVLLWGSLGDLFVGSIPIAPRHALIIQLLQTKEAMVAFLFKEIPKNRPEPPSAIGLGLWPACVWLS